MNSFTLDAACACRVGRDNRNVANFYFDERCLQAGNKGLRHSVRMSRNLQREICFAVFDGIRELEHGEAASLAAARGMQTLMQRLDSYCIPEKTFLQETCQSLHGCVLQEKESLHAERMGTSMAALFFSQDYVYLCSLGDTRAYRLRGGEFLQLTIGERSREGAEKTGFPAQFLGMDAGEQPVKPFIAKGELHVGDKYVICSEGLTSVLSNLEIDDVLLCNPDPGNSAQALADKALLKGTRKDVTVMVIDVLGSSVSSARRQKPSGDA